MNWALVGPLHPYRGGIAHYGALLAHELARKDEVFALNFSLLYPGFLFPGRTQLDESQSAIAFPSSQRLSSIDPLSWERSAKLLAERDFDAVIFQWWHPFFGPAYGWMARRLAKLSPRTRRLFLCHNVEPHEASAVDRSLSRYGRRRAQGFLAHSQHDAARLAEMYPASVQRVHAHPRYSALGESRLDRASARAQCGLSSDERALLFFGLVREYKGLDLALEALAKLDMRYRLHVVGEFYEKRTRYDALIARLGLQERVNIVDRYVPNEEVPAWFAAADLVVLPYRDATQSGIVEIAHGAGRASLVTDVGGLSAQVQDGRTGLVVKPDDAAAIAEAVERYFDGNLEALMQKAIMEEAGSKSWAGLATTLRELAAEINS
ncbi:glycosyltransferase [bacterium]|nr:glycosyltransferase [bacterium]